MRLHSAAQGLISINMTGLSINGTGPALLAYNNASFSENDFTSISRIGDSQKKDEGGKTGRFGIGFNSCYHLTDLPSFVSASHLVFFDPHVKHLPDVSAANPGKVHVADKHLPSHSLHDGDPKITGPV